MTLGLAGWAVVGPATVDDGYIAGILRARDSSGFTGNVYRWLNAPEAPFSWFYELTRAWAELAPGAPSVLWLRVPATVLGLLIWILLRRHALPRLGPALRRPGATWVAAAAFAAWWLPFGLSLRPEPWLALGVLAVWVCVERAVAAGRSAAARGRGGRRVHGGADAGRAAGPRAAARGAARAGPGGARRAGGMDPHARRRGRARRRRAADGRRPVARRAARGHAGAPARRGRQPWWQELSRYSSLLEPGNVQGGIGARLAVLLTLLALAAVAWALLAARVRAGVAVGPARRLLAVTALGPVTLIVSPTKWTLHFGELAGVGTAVLTLFVVLWSPRLVASVARLRGPALVVVLGGLGLVTTLVLIGYNQWAWASAWGVFWNDIPPQIARVALGDVALPVTIVGALVLGVLVAVRGGRPAGWPGCWRRGRWRSSS